MFLILPLKNCRRQPYLANGDVKEDEASASHARGVLAAPVHAAFKAAVYCNDACSLLLVMSADFHLMK